MSLEAELKAAVVDLLNRTGELYFRMNSGKVKVKRGFIHLHPEGTADFLIMRRGEVLWLELKGEGQATKKERIAKQAAFAEMVRSYEHRYARCKTLDEVVTVLKG